ncbi:hypothetical protein AAMO2058_001133700 [Amorphochlora amoebiformis]
MPRNGPALSGPESIRKDPCPKLRPAGYIPKGDGLTAGGCLNENEMRSGRPPTPDHLKGYLNRHKHPVGHHAPSTNPNANPDARYGKKNAYDDGFALTNRPITPGRLAKYIQEKPEALYASKKPLGKVISRGNYPNDLTVTHGKPSGESESAKSLLYSDPCSMAKASFQNSGSAALNGIVKHKNRNYDWPNSAIKDPNNHRFGRKQTGPHGPVGSQLHNDIKMQEDTKVINKRVTDYRNRMHAPLGRCRNLSGNVAKLPSDFVFGKPGLKGEESTKLCIHDFPKYYQVPDNDLGKSVKRLGNGFKIKEKKKHDLDRVFGIPSIRRDIKAPKMRSVGDPTNYGDEFNAKAILYPEPFAYDGVKEDDFLAKRPPKEIRDLFEAIGVKFSDPDFDALVKQASSSPDGLSVESFRRAYNKTNTGIIGYSAGNDVKCSCYNYTAGPNGLRICPICGGYIGPAP